MPPPRRLRLVVILDLSDKRDAALAAVLRPLLRSRRASHVIRDVLYKALVKESA